MASFQLYYDLNKHTSNRDSILELHPASLPVTAIRLLAWVNICGIVRLALGSFDMVLDVEWLEALGPILWDFGSRTMGFVCNGHRILWSAADSGGLFKAPVGLPPQ
jgi:hypothetical protein